MRNATWILNLILRVKGPDFFGMCAARLGVRARCRLCPALPPLHPNASPSAVWHPDEVTTWATEPSTRQKRLQAQEDGVSSERCH